MKIEEIKERGAQEDRQTDRKIWVCNKSFAPKKNIRGGGCCLTVLYNNVNNQQNIFLYSYLRKRKFALDQIKKVLLAKTLSDRWTDRTKIIKSDI